MPDRYDPKLSVRPPSERRPEAAAPDDDPLAELARIVTGRSTFDPPPAAKSKTVPVADSSPEANLARDLESELLNDLQASFAALREPFEPQQPSEPPTEEPAEEDQGPSAEQTARSHGPQAPESPTPAEPSGPPPGSDADLEDVLAGLRSPPPPRPAEPAPATPRLVPSPPRPAARETHPEPPPPVEQADQPPMPRQAAAVERAAVTEPPAAREPVVSGGRPAPAEARDFSRLRLRPAPPVAPADDNAAALPRQPPRWNRADDSKRSLERLSRFAPPRAAARNQPEPTPEPEAVAEDVGAYVETSGPDAVETDFEDSFTLEDLDAAAFAPDDDLPPFPEEELAGLKRRRTGRALAVIGGLLIIVLAGGAAYLLLGNDNSTSGPPPIITADGTPNKVVPDEPAAGESDQQGKLIYDRVDEGGSGSDKTTLVTSGDDAIADIPPVDEQASDNPISRVIIPGGPGIDGPIEASGDGGTAGDGGAVISEGDAPTGEPDQALGPKKVRTVVVRPDGTIVSSEAVDEGSDAMPAGDAAIAEGDPSMADPANIVPSTRTDMDAVLEGEDLPVNTDPLATAGSDGAAQGAAEPLPGTVPAGDEVAKTEDIPEPPAASSAPAARPATASPAPQPRRQTVASTGNAGGPIDLTPGTSARASGPQAGSGGVLVQVSAQRTEDAARSTYRTLQSRYPSILGPYQAAIIRADLGDRGIYYRVRIGPFSSNDAARLCDDLKAAGGDCILAR